MTKELENLVLNIIQQENFDDSNLSYKIFKENFKFKNISP